MRLKATSFSTLHVLADRADAGDIHRVGSQGAVLKQAPQMVVVQGMFDHLRQPGAGFGLVAVADRLQEQFPQRAVVEHETPQDVEDLTTEGAAFFIQLFKQPVADFALAGILGYQVPKVAHFGLTDAVDASEPLLQTVGIPREVVIDHQVPALQVDAFTGGIGGNEDFDLLVLHECVLGLATFLAPMPPWIRTTASGRPRRDPVRSWR